MWEALKEFNGHREVKSLFPKGHIGRNAEYKTIEEYMNGLEKFSKKGRLTEALKHHRQWGGEDCG